MVYDLLVFSCSYLVGEAGLKADFRVRWTNEVIRWIFGDDGSSKMCGYRELIETVRLARGFLFLVVIKRVT